MLPKVMFNRHGSCLTTVHHNLCDTHLSPRGMQSGEGSAYVFFHATHLGTYCRADYAVIWNLADGQITPTKNNMQ